MQKTTSDKVKESARQNGRSSPQQQTQTPQVLGENLQQLLGNRAVGRLAIQRKMTLNALQQEVFKYDLTRPPQQASSIFRYPIYLDEGTKFRGYQWSKSNNTPTKWDTSNFVKWYYFGNGRAVALKEIGLLTDFKNASSVKKETNDFLKMIPKWMKMIARAMNALHEDARSDKFSFNSTTNVTDEDNMFAIGRSTFFRSCDYEIEKIGTNTYYFNCLLTFKIRDWFKDPLDMKSRLGEIDLPFSKPYRINGQWTETLSKVIVLFD